MMSSPTLRFNESTTVVDRLVNFFVEHEDLRTKSWFLCNAPGPLFMILGAYLYFCLHAGPRYMHDRKPIELKNTLLVYNGVQVVLSWVLFYEVKLNNFNTIECNEKKFFFCRDLRVDGEVIIILDVNQLPMLQTQYQ